MRRPRVRITLRRMMLVLACLGVALALVRKLREIDPFFGTGTFYASGYDENRFNQIRAGMSAADVEATIGPPLEKIPWNQGTGPPGQEMWAYSDRPDPTTNYWRRWVVLEDGKVIDVISDFWVD